MKVKHYVRGLLTAAFISLSIAGMAQGPCDDLPEIKRLLNQAIDDLDLQNAQRQLSALRACDPTPEGRAYIDAQYQRFTGALDLQRRIAEQAQRQAEQAQRQAEQAQHRAEQARKDAEQARQEAQTITKDALIRAYMSQARQLLDSYNYSDENFTQAVQIVDFAYKYIDSEHPALKQMILYLFTEEKRSHIQQAQLANAEEINSYFYTDIARAPYGNVIALASDPNGYLLIIDLETDQVQQLAPFDGYSFETLAWSNDGETLAAYNGASLHFWSTTTWELLEMNRELPSNVKALAWHPDDSTLAAACTDGNSYLIDPATAEIFGILPFHTDYTRDLAWSPDGSQLVSVSDDGVVMLWNPVTMDTIRSLRVHLDWIYAVDWHPSRDLIISGDQAGYLYRWNPKEESNLPPPSHYLGGTIMDLKFSPSGNLLVVINDLGEFLLMDPISFNSIDYLVFSGFTAQRISWSQDGRTVLLIGDDEQLRQYEVSRSGIGAETAISTREILPDDSTTRLLLPGDENLSLNAVAWENDARLAAGDTKGTIRLFLYQGEECLVDTIQTYQGVITDLDWSPNGQLASAGDNRTINIWDPNAKSLIKSLTVSYLPNAVGWSYDGNYLAVGDDYGYVQVWETQNWTQVLSQRQHDGAVLSIAWPHGNSRYLASGGVDNMGWVWDLQTQVNAPLDLHTDWVRDVKWLPGDSLLVTAADDFQTVIWRWGKNQEATVKYPLVNRSNWHYAVAISDDGQLAVVAIGEGIVGFWDISGEQPQELGAINIIETPIRDLDWRPGRATIAGSVPNGVPIMLTTFDLGFHYDEVDLDPTLIEESKGEHKIPRNAYHEGPLHIEQFCWLNGRNRYAHLEPGRGSSSPSMMRSEPPLRTPSPSSIPLPALLRSYHWKATAWWRSPIPLMPSTMM